MVSLGGRQDKKLCQYCNEEIGSSAFLRHESKCQNLTPEHRIKQTFYRERALAAYYKRPKQPAIAVNGKVQTKPPDDHRVQLTLSVDLKSLRNLLMELGPSLRLDKVVIL